MSALLNKAYDLHKVYEAPVNLQPINLQVAAEPIEIHQIEPVTRANPWIRGLGTVMILWLALMVSGITLVYSKHVMRQRVYELQALQDNWDQMQVEWHRMLLEQGTWGGLTRIEQVATDHLGMKTPSADNVIIVKKQP